MSSSVEKTYKKVTQIQHILMRPDMYVGSMAETEEQLWILQGDRFQFTKIKYIPALYKIFDQILVNAADNYQRDKKMSVIRVEFNKDEISVMNDGKSIPVQMHKTHKMLVPQLIFGHLLTSSNYEDNEKKTTGGRNGFGAKLTNIFSLKFSIEIADSVNKKMLKIVWENNMTLMSSPVLEDYEGKSYTKVTFTPDYKRFGMAKMSNDMLNLLKRRVYDISGLIRVNVYLNNKLVQVPNFKQYVNYYLQDNTQIIAEVEKNKQARWQVIVCRSEGQFMQVSFVNCIHTSKGGTHVNYILDQITDKILQFVAKKKQPPIKPFQIKAKLKIFVNCLIENPSFDSQIKENLTTHHTQFGSLCQVSEEFIKDILKSGIIEKIQQEQQMKQYNKIGKELRRIKKNRLIIPKLDDANEAGKSDECCLILTEGDSAKSLALCGIEELGRDYYGVYPLKGKLVNVKQLSPKQVMENAELSNLVKIIGLQFGEEYTSTKKLRYSSVMIMADQDNDGSHIKGLVINFFETFWPSLCKIKGFLKEFITPIIKCNKGHNTITFYSQVDYRQWLETADDGWAIKYYKGLGTSTAREAKQYFTQLEKHELIFNYCNNEDKQSLDLAFGKKNADLRKSWLSTYNPNISIDHCVKEIKVSDFIHKQLIHFSISDNVRSIPSVIDGLKPSQRKVLFSCFKRNLVNQIKVAQLAGYVSEHSAYHHGEMSLCSTIIGMAQNYVGSNNLNLLQPIGQFGTRYQTGKDAASARYIFTKLNKLTRFLFNEADDHVIDYIFEENLTIEPRYYIPILPLVLINGCQGIGTGWSTTVFPHKILDVIQMVRKRIKGQFWEISIGWENFKGTIQKDKKSFIVKGICEKNGQRVIIRQIPPNKSISSYKEFLQQQLSSSENANPIIQDLRQYHYNSNIEFSIKFVEEYEPQADDLLKFLKLTSTFQQNNMHLFTSQGKIKKYQNIFQILEDFYQERMTAYHKRKKYLLSKFQKQYRLLINQIRFIESVMNGEFKMIEKKDEWIDRLKRYEFNTYQQLSKIFSTKIKQDEEQSRNKDYNYLLTMPIWSFCREKIEDLSKTKEQLSTIIDYYQKVTVEEMWIKDIDAFQDVWRSINQQNQQPKSQKSISLKPNLKRKRPTQLDPEEQIKPKNSRRNKKQNLMEEQISIETNKKSIQPELQPPSDSLDLSVNDKAEVTIPNIERLLAKYLGSSGRNEQMSLQMRVRARLSNGDDTFNESYKAVKEEMQKSKNEIREQDSLDLE